VKLTETYHTRLLAIGASSAAAPASALLRYRQSETVWSLTAEDAAFDERSLRRLGAVVPVVSNFPARASFLNW